MILVKELEKTEVAAALAKVRFLTLPKYFLQN
jgi:hypothetical protein